VVFDVLFFFTFLDVFFAVAVLLWLALLFAFGVLPAGCCAAKVSGMVATAKPIASSVFFMIPFSPWGGLSFLPAHSFILRPDARKNDSLRWLTAVPNSG
jgi:hypothetical protein